MSCAVGEVRRRHIVQHPDCQLSEAERGPRVRAAENSPGPPFLASRKIEDPDSYGRSLECSRPHGSFSRGAIQPMEASPVQPVAVHFPGFVSISLTGICYQESGIAY